MRGKINRPTHTFLFYCVGVDQSLVRFALENSCVLELCFRTVVPWIAGGYLNWVGVRWWLKCASPVANVMLEHSRKANCGVLLKSFLACLWGLVPSPALVPHLESLGSCSLIWTLFSHHSGGFKVILRSVCRDAHWIFLIYNTKLAQSLLRCAAPKKEISCGRNISAAVQVLCYFFSYISVCKYEFCNWSRHSGRSSALNSSSVVLVWKAQGDTVLRHNHVLIELKNPSLSSSLLLCWATDLSQVVSFHMTLVNRTAS